MATGPSTSYVLLVGTFVLLPFLHPLLIPLVGIPSHLLWFSHVLPVALLTYRFGRSAGSLATLASAALVVAGERLIGAGYASPAPWETALSLGMAILLVDGLVAAFALYARRMTSRYQLLFDTITMGVIRTDGLGLVVSANPAALGILRARETQLVGRSIADILLPSAPGSLEELARRGAWTGKLELQLNGQNRPLHAFLAAIPMPDGDGYQLLVADRSVQVLHEVELQRQSKLATLGEALAGVAHEMNNPLTTIIGYAHLANDEEGNAEERAEALQVIQEQAARIQGLVGELLGFSRPVDDGRRDVPLGQLLDRIIRVQRMALPAGVTLTEEGRCESLACTAPNKFEQIVINLISNAGDVLTEDGGEISVSCRHSEDWVQVEVRDDGPGIAGDILASVFEPFVTTKPEGQGTGLGLAISRRLARSMGGDLSAANLPGGGASFVLRLPAIGCEEPLATAESAVATTA